MAIYQIVPFLAFGDGVGNDLLAIQKILNDITDETDIFAYEIDKRLPEGTAKKIEEMPEVSKEDVVIFHFATGSDMVELFGNLPCKRVLRYHNITPPEFYKGYRDPGEIVCTIGYEQLDWLKDKVDYCLAVSEFNKSDLIKHGYICDIDVLPILIPFSDYDIEPAENVINKYSDDGITNLLFVGRVAPNKKHEDIIRAFYNYKKYYNKDSRLFLVGSYKEEDRYYCALKKYLRVLGLSENDVIFLGHIRFDEIIAYYKIADAFICMSEHEGFCIPLVEAMYLGTPIIAYNKSAVGNTLGGSGILLDRKNAEYIAGIIHQLICNIELKNKVLNNQKEKLKDYNHSLVTEQLIKFLKEKEIL